MNSSTPHLKVQQTASNLGFWVILGERSLWDPSNGEISPGKKSVASWGFFYILLLTMSNPTVFSLLSKVFLLKWVAIN